MDHTLLLLDHFITQGTRRKRGLAEGVTCLHRGVRGSSGRYTSHDDPQSKSWQPTCFLNLRYKLRQGRHWALKHLLGAASRKSLSLYVHLGIGYSEAVPTVSLVTNMTLEQGSARGHEFFRVVRSSLNRTLSANRGVCTCLSRQKRRCPLRYVKSPSW